MNAHSFPPPKRLGMLLHGVLLAVFASTSIAGFAGLSRAAVGPSFVGYLMVAMLAFIPVPYFIYRLYSLSRADYQIGREHLIIRWGLRLEEIPLSDIEWVRPAADLAHPLHLPFLSVPGGILGLRRHPDLGLVEFIASRAKDLLLVATARRVFAISPADARAFMHSFARSVELGSLSPSEARSVYPTFVVSRAWDSGLARFVWLIALFLNIGLLVWVGTLIPSMPEVALGLSTGRGIVETVPSTQLILLPLANTVLTVAGWLAGLSLYRWDKQRQLAFVVWISGALSSLAFLIGVLFIISTPV
ncbi:MAG: PH domain-containing protein [Bacteroidota bacterium]